MKHKINGFCSPLLSAFEEGAVTVHCCYKRFSCGFTLVEVMVAICIFAFALMPIMGLFGRGSLLTQINSDYSTAVQVCSSYLRSLSALPAAEIPLGNPVPLDRDFGTLSTNRVTIPSKAVLNATEFNYRLKVAYVMRNATAKNLWFDFMTAPGKVASMTVYKQFLKLDFEVSWRTRRNGELQKVRLFTYKADLE